MTQPPSYSNRATLEDCHTNFFALTDLGGIRWRKLFHKGNGVFANRTVEPHNDLILSSYSKCLQAELLCVWRRVLPPADPFGPQQAPINFLNGPKELWIFWYGEEPDFTSLVHPDLLTSNETQPGTQGSWEEGLSYECRTLLFKALHNLIERCLLARDYVRLGRWFIQPYPSSVTPTPPDSSHLAFSFTYFLHGESTVVSSLDVRQQVAVRRVQSLHLVASQHSEIGTQVLLAPWGLAGTLTGVSWKLGDPVCDQTLKEWRQFYPIPTDFQHLDVPPVIEVSISGMRVRYPSIYVLVTDLDTHSPQLQKQGIIPQPNSPLSGSLAYGEPAAPFAASSKHSPISGGLSGNAVLSSTLHDSISNTEASGESMVEIGDPQSKSPCHCPSKRKGGANGGSSHSRSKLSFHKRQAIHTQSQHMTDVEDAPSTPKPLAPPAPTYIKTDMKPPPEKSPGCSIGPSPYSAGPRSMPMLSPQPIPSIEQNHDPPASVEAKHTPYDFVNSAPNTHQSPGSNLGKEPFTPKSVQPQEMKSEDGILTKDEDQDSEPTLNSLYNYGVTKAWLNHPVRSLRYQDMHPEGKICVDGVLSLETDFDDGRPGSRQEDDERGLKRKEPFRDDDDSKFLTMKGLEVSYSDLDNMFDDDTPDGQDPIPPTPPGSNKPADSACDETKLITPKCAISSPGSFIGPAELSKMFPTPPSHEYPLPSPVDAGSPSSPHVDLDRDHVYRPYPMANIIGSSTYSPLTDLPSSRLPPLILPKEYRYIAEPKQMQQFSRPPSVPQRAPIPLVPRPGVSPISPSPFTPQRNTHPTGIPTLHANALLVNVLLSDSLVNVFRDHNFESCSLCVCNAGPNLVGNIKGRDSALYLPDALKRNPTEDDSIGCDCGFSALVNRRLASGSGLFYEDEVDICGGNHTLDPSSHRKIPLQNLVQTLCKIPPKEALQLFSDCGFNVSTQSAGDNPAVIDHPGQALLDLIRDSCLVLLSECSSLCELATSSPVSERLLNQLEFLDGCEIVQMVMEQARIGPDPYMGRYDPYGFPRPDKLQPKPLHRWSHVQAMSASCSQDVLRVMKCLQPLLQEATQKRRTPRLWEAGFMVQGPLTWRQFHRITAKGTDDNCEPLPIPLVVCGYDREWLCVGPHSFSHWERLALEPYAANRDVAYVVVAPDSEHLLSCAKMFFRELSTTYENCRLGKHRPITKVLRDGILRVNRTTLAKLQTEPADEWFNAIGDSNVAHLLKAYAQACRHSLAPHLATIPLDQSLLENNSGSKNMAPPVMSGQVDQENSQQQSGEENSQAAQSLQYSSQSTNSQQSQSQGNDEGVPSSHELNNNEEEEPDPPTIVVYVLDPFSCGPFKGDVNIRRFGTIGLLRCLNQMTQALSENLQANIAVQLISMESVLSVKSLAPEIHRGIAFQMYSQCRRSLTHQCNVKSLTGLGPAAQLDVFLKSRDERYKVPHRLYCPPYVLAPICEKGVENEFGASSLMSLPRDKAQTLYVSYCLSHDQRYLLATATDDRGELRESCTISIEVPRRRRRISARRNALNRLMDFIVGVLSQSVLPWRLVIGRLGRVGHGELKGWSCLLSRNSLQRISQQLSELCGQCRLLSPLESPGIISACLVSLEPDSALQVFTDQVTPDERSSQPVATSNLSTPEDCSTTHIMVFPMSAATALPQACFPGSADMNPDLEENLDEIFGIEDDMGGGMLGDMGDMGDMDGLFDWDMDGGMTPGSPTNGGNQGQMQAQSQQNEFGGYMMDQNSMSHMGGPGRPSGEVEEVGLVLQQPLALGYYVSTVTTGNMPDWFWSSCPHLASNDPVFLKAALHLHSSSVHQNADENPIGQSANGKEKCHPLDSKYTTDVLRYVLEGYNALSWLAVDSSGRDRRSCLPVHIQLLVQLYHAFSNLI